MKAMVLASAQVVENDSTPLQFVECPRPDPKDHELLIEISTCGVCHTELDEIEGRTPPSSYPRILGHQVVGTVVGLGRNATVYAIGERVGVAWIFSACGKCIYCLNGEENLCPDFRATGRDADGGYAEFMTVSESFAVPVPENLKDAEAAPLLCAGAIGYRSVKLANIQDGQNLGLAGFGASAHLVLKMVRHQYPNTKIYVFTRSESEGDFALELGAIWSGNLSERSPELLHSVIDTTPAWQPVIGSLANLQPGGRLVINAIRKEDNDKAKLSQLDYPSHLWMEKEIKSVANVTRKDVTEFLSLAASIQMKPEYQEYALQEANVALQELKARKIRGAKVLKIS